LTEPSTSARDFGAVPLAVLVAGDHPSTAAVDKKEPFGTLEDNCLWVDVLG